MSTDERIRLFCALRLPDPVLDELERWQREALGPGAPTRPVGRGNMHVTLAFLGSRPAGDAPLAAAELRAAAAAARPPILRVERYRETRSVGMLVLEDEDGIAGRLALDLHERLERGGLYTREARAWLAHVTVVRFRERPHLRPQVPELGAFGPSDAALYNSVLRSTGAQYEIIESVALGG